MSHMQAEGNGVGDLKEPPVSFGNCVAMAENKIIPVYKLIKLASLLDKRCVVRMEFVMVIEGLRFRWLSMLIDGKLFVEIPKMVLPEGSKESFITLLEFAECILGCSHVIICFKKDRPDRASLIKVFMFLGFQLLGPNNPLVPINPTGSVLYLAYAIDGQDEEEENE